MLTPAEVHKLGVELYNAGRYEQGYERVDPDVVDYSGGVERRGIDAWRAARGESGWAADFENLSVTVEQNVAAGEFSVNRYLTRGRHKKSGKEFAVLGMDMIRVRDGKIVEHWALMDVTRLREQLED